MVWLGLLLLGLVFVVGSGRSASAIQTTGVIRWGPNPSPFSFKSLLGLVPVKPIILSTPEIEVPVKVVLFSFSPASAG